jgi:hypothetical protein
VGGFSGFIVIKVIFREILLQEPLATGILKVSFGVLLMWIALIVYHISIKLLGQDKDPLLNLFEMLLAAVTAGVTGGAIAAILLRLAGDLG